MSHDYLREIDLNPMINGAPAPINNPLDPRAHHDFCFLSDQQEITLARSMTTGTAVRVLFSFDCGHQALINQPFPPPGTGPEVHGLLTFDPTVGDDPERRIYRPGCCHQRRFVKVWLDMPQPPAGVPVIVIVGARAKEPSCA